MHISPSLTKYVGVYSFLLVSRLQNGESHITVKINKWTEVSTLLQLYSEECEVSVLVDDYVSK